MNYQQSLINYISGYGNSKDKIIEKFVFLNNTEEKHRNIVRNICLLYKHLESLNLMFNYEDASRFDIPMDYAFKSIKEIKSEDIEDYEDFLRNVLGSFDKMKGFLFAFNKDSSGYFFAKNLVENLYKLKELIIKVSKDNMYPSLSDRKLEILCGFDLHPIDVKVLKSPKISNHMSESLLDL